MKFKFDENLEGKPIARFRQAGHDAIGVIAEGLSGADDERVASVSQSENRCLLTLDLDFANTLHFPPRGFAGIIVLRPPKPKLRLIYLTS
ncbi:MAG: DUF5615 family PIN-like protein [bacterium]